MRTGKGKSCRKLSIRPGQSGSWQRRTWIIRDTSDAEQVQVRSGRHWPCLFVSTGEEPCPGRLGSLLPPRSGIRLGSAQHLHFPVRLVTTTRTCEDVHQAWSPGRRARQRTDCREEGFSQCRKYPLVLQLRSPMWNRIINHLILRGYYQLTLAQAQHYLRLRHMLQPPWLARGGYQPGQVETSRLQENCRCGEPNPIPTGWRG